MVGVKPDVQRNLGVFVNGPYRHTERLAAGIAPVNARTGGLALQSRGVAQDTTMGANRTVLPEQAFQIFACCISVGETCGQPGRHWQPPIKPVQTLRTATSSIQTHYADNVITP